MSEERRRFAWDVRYKRGAGKQSYGHLYRQPSYKHVSPPSLVPRNGPAFIHHFVPRLPSSSLPLRLSFSFPLSLASRSAVLAHDSRLFFSRPAGTLKKKKEERRRNLSNDKPLVRGCVTGKLTPRTPPFSLVPATGNRIRSATCYIPLPASLNSEKTRGFCGAFRSSWNGLVETIQRSAIQLLLVGSSYPLISVDTSSYLLICRMS